MTYLNRNLQIDLVTSFEKSISKLKDFDVQVEKIREVKEVYENLCSEISRLLTKYSDKLDNDIVECLESFRDHMLDGLDDFSWHDFKTHEEYLIQKKEEAQERDYQSMVMDYWNNR